MKELMIAVTIVSLAFAAAFSQTADVSKVADAVSARMHSHHIGPHGHGRRLEETEPIKADCPTGEESYSPSFWQCQKGLPIMSIYRSVQS